MSAFPEGADPAPETLTECSASPPFGVTILPTCCDAGALSRPPAFSLSIFKTLSRGPSATSDPFSRTTSRETSDSIAVRCVVRMTVCSGRNAPFRRSIRARSEAMSMDPDGSSRNKISGSNRNARASAIAWRCPLDRNRPVSPTGMLKPCGCGFTKSETPARSAARTTRSSETYGAPCWKRWG